MSDAMETALWQSTGSSPSNLTFYVALGVVLTAAVIATIWTYAMTYFDHFGRSDHPAAVTAVAVGLVIASATLGLQIAQLYEITRSAFGDYASIIRFDFVSLVAQVCIGQWVANVACGFYAFRVYRLLRRPWYVPAVVGTLVIACGVWTFPHFIQGVRMPPITLENFTNGRRQAWWLKYKHYHQVELALALARCGTTGCFMLKVLFLPRTTLFSVEKKIYRRLVSMMLETMLPSCLILLVLEASWGLRATPLVDWRRAIIPLTTPLHMLFILHTLTSRLTIRRILSDELSAQGIEHNNSSGRTAGSNIAMKNVHVSYSSGDRTRVSTGGDDADASSVKSNEVLV